MSRVKAELLKIAIYFALMAVVIVPSAFVINNNLEMSKEIILKDNTLRQYNVLIETIKEGYNGPSFGLGSGVVISENGTIITAGHVLRDAQRVRVTLHDGRVFDVNDFYVDEEVDIGILSIPAETKIYTSLCDSNDLVSGCTIVGVGNPGGIRVDIIINGKIENGKFRRLFFKKDVDFILSKMPVEPGFSGGGVYVDGKLVGIMILKVNDFAVSVSSNVCLDVVKKWTELNAFQK